MEPLRSGTVDDDDNARARQLDAAAPSRRSTALGLALLVSLLAALAAAKAVIADTLDPDCFWHLKVAEQLSADGIGPLVDRLSYSSVREPWTPYSWLAELGMKALWDAGGHRAAVGAQALMQAAFVLLVALACREGCRPGTACSGKPWFTRKALSRAACGPRRGQEPQAARLKAAHRDGGARRNITGGRDGNVDVEGDYEGGGDRPTRRNGGGVRCIVATAFATYLSLPYLSFRPVTMALVLLAGIAWLLLRDRRLGERSRAAWLVVPATVLIVNLHLTAVFAPLWTGCLAAGAALEWTKSWDRDLELKRRTRRYVGLTLAAALGCLATPMLPGAMAAAVRYPFGDVMVASRVIAEMQPFYRGGPMAVAVTSVVLAAVGTCLWRGRRAVRAGEWLRLLASAALMLRLGRFAPLFALIAAPLLAATLPRMSDRVLGRPVVRAALACCLLLVVGRTAADFPRAAAPLSEWLGRNGPDVPGYPCAAADYVAALPPRAGRGRLINEFNWGGYLAWRLGDRYAVLLDGRTQVFSRDFWHDTYLGTDADRRRTLTAAGADAAVLPARGSVFRESLGRLGWTTAYRDERAEVMLPPARAVAATDR